MDFKRTLLIAALPLAFCLSGVAQAEIKIKFAEVHPTGYPPVVAEQEMGKKLQEQSNGDISFKMFAGGVLGGVFSDYLIKRGFSITLARKLPIVLGMLLASTIILCNYTDNTTLVVALMALAFFGKGFGALGWPVISDTAPKEIVGLCGGVFNVFGNVASIVTPLVIGYLVSELHSFNAALMFVGCSALMAMVCYLFIVGDIKRMELQK